MLVAMLFFATANVAAIHPQNLASPDLSGEAKVLTRLKDQMCGGDPEKTSSIDFFKRTQDGLVAHFEWNTFTKTATITVTLGRHDSDFIVDKKPTWTDRATVMGFEAVVAKVGTVRKLDDETWSEAGCWVAATPYDLHVRFYPAPDTPMVWDTTTWTAHNAKAKEIAESAIQLLAGAGYVKLSGEDKEGSLVISAQTNSGEVLGGLQIHLDIPGRKTPMILTTDGFGRAKAAVPIYRSDRDLIATASACTYTKQTKVGGIPMYIANSMTLEISNTFTLKKAADFKGNLDMRFYVRPIYVRVEHSDSSDPVTDCTVSLHQGDLNGEVIIRVYAREDAKRDASGALVLRVPVTRTNGGSRATVYAAAKVKGVAYEGWEEVALPSNTVESAAVIIELTTQDIGQQFKKYASKLKAELTKAGFSADEVARIMAAKIRIGKKNNYLNGVIQLAPDSKLRGSSENLLHEFGHLITDVFAPDEPEGVGITHEVDDAVNLNAAWDEGRAHFYSTLLGQIAGLPGAKPTTTAPSGIDNCENRELFIQRALLEHYGDKALFATPTAALSNFREVHVRGREQMGRPPRTIIEFLNIASTMPGATEAQKRDLQRIRLEYGFGPTQLPSTAQLEGR